MVFIRGCKATFYMRKKPEIAGFFVKNELYFGSFWAKISKKLIYTIL